MRALARAGALVPDRSKRELGFTLARVGSVTESVYRQKIARPVEVGGAP